MDIVIANMQRQMAFNAMLWLAMLVGLIALAVWLFRWAVSEHREDQDKWRSTIERAAGVRRHSEPSWGKEPSFGAELPRNTAPEGYVWVLVKTSDIETREAQT